MSQKRVYLFGNGKAEGNAKMREELGGKGANLAEMNLLGVPVPPGFTITTDCCNEYYQVGQQKIMELLNDDVMAAVKHIEVLMNSKFGDKENPLLVSVRSGARASMPGMMDTILNLGLNDEVAEGMVNKTQNPHFVYDSYRRFVQMYGDVVVQGCHQGAHRKGLPQRSYRAALGRYLRCVPFLDERARYPLS